MTVRKYSQRWIEGDYKVNCERCGWDYRRSELVKEEITNALVCTQINCLDEPSRVQLKRKYPKEQVPRIDGGGSKDPESQAWVQTGVDQSWTDGGTWTDEGNVWRDSIRPK